MEACHREGGDQDGTEVLVNWLDHFLLGFTAVGVLFILIRLSR